ncbi:MAG: MBL fold metallo-hydrolase [Candidatus Fimivivens sp.]|nr:MBL fold metallo-hydrolase [Candidatus Fimivivens sp.]
MKIRLLALLCAAAMLLSLIGCAQTASSPVVTSQTASSDTASSESSTSTTEVNRYSEIIKVPEGKFTIYFLQLDYVTGDSDKSGDCSLLISPEGKTMLIDAGNVSCYRQILDYLADIGISKIDYLVVSHPHVDHIGSIVEVARNHEIGMHYRTELEYVSNTYVDYSAYFKKNSIPTTFLHEGDAFNFGESIHVKILNPPKQINYPASYPENSTQFVNNTSLAMRFDYGKSSYLTCGDLYLGSEKELVEKYPQDVDVDIVKANHHGRDTSNSLKWVKAVSPQYVVAMSDDISSMTVYERYKNKGTSYYNTSYDGIVRISMDDSGNYEVLTQHDSWLRD